MTGEMIDGYPFANDTSNRPDIYTIRFNILEMVYSTPLYREEKAHYR
jgi:hypothetical protein